MAMQPLGPRVRALFADLAHAGELEPAGATAPLDQRLRGEAGSVPEGTQVRFSLRLAARRRAEGRVLEILEVRYRAYGCPYTLACCEWLARELTGRELTGRELTGRQLGAATADALVALVGTPTQWAADLGVPAPRLGRLLVIEDALRAALGGAD
jgi:hypothetical protein